MSVIAAKVNEDCITICSDSILLKSELKRTNFKKIFYTSNMCVGTCGSAEELCLFQTFLQLYTIDAPTTSAILDYMKQFAKWKSDYINDDVIHNCYLILYKDKLFEIDGMFVQEITDYTAIGEGEAYALTALHLGHTVEEAVRATCELCCYTSEPIVSVTMKQGRIYENTESN